MAKFFQSSTNFRSGENLVLHMTEKELAALKAAIEHEITYICGDYSAMGIPPLPWEEIWHLAIALGIDVENPPYWADEKGA